MADRGTATANDDEVAKELARRVVSRIAPDELPLFDQTWSALGRRSGRRVRRREEPLGFGLPEAEATIVTAVASGVAVAVVKDLGKEVGSWSVRAMGRLRRSKNEVPEAQPSLSAARLQEIRTIAHDKARKLGMSEPKACALADAVISELSTRDS